tara:strand:+ start:411 stop:989 length:579 start_codon:yes stop_codon:yes gene_type:complete
MQKKILLQIFLLVIILTISAMFYKTYFVNINIEKNITEKRENNLKKKDSSIIYNIKYTSQSTNGNGYTITSETGELNDTQPELILMKKVKAIIKFKNSSSMQIEAENAFYNSDNYDTSFYTNVIVNFDEHIIESNNLDLSLEKSLVSISNNVIYKNLNTRLQADKVDIDLITKNSKIFMDDNSKKVKIININ